MRKRIRNRVKNIRPTKMLRREQFVNRIKNRKRHYQRYNAFSFLKHNPKASHFNRWQDYKRNRLTAHTRS